MILSAWLKEHDVKRRDFAKRIGVTPIMVTDYCSGKSWPGKKVMRAIERETAGAVTANDFVSLEAAE